MTRRVLAGVPAGGQFAAQHRTDAEISLALIEGRAESDDIFGIPEETANAIARRHLDGVVANVEASHRARGDGDVQIAEGRARAHAEAFLMVTADDAPHAAGRAFRATALVDLMRSRNAPRSLRIHPVEAIASEFRDEIVLMLDARARRAEENAASLADDSLLWVAAAETYRSAAAEIRDAL